MSLVTAVILYNLSEITWMLHRHPKTGDYTMISEIANICLRTTIICIVFAYFVFAPMQSRFRYSIRKTLLWVSSLVIITVLISGVFLSKIGPLHNYIIPGIMLWLLSAWFILCRTIKESRLEILFLVLMVLNLYVNVMTAAMLLSDSLGFRGYASTLYTVAALIIVLIYIPFFHVLFFRLFKKVLVFGDNFSFWKFIWIIPTLTYLIFYIKIINDYWRNRGYVKTWDIVFIILWSVTTYAFFAVTLQMLVLAHKGTVTDEQVKFIKTQLRMQEEQYKRLLENNDSVARIRHDWRHHLLSINGFVESKDMDSLSKYLEKLFPEYVNYEDVSVCTNHVVDIILGHYGVTAKTNGIHMNIKAEIPQKINVQDTDLCIVFGNLVENAVEACTHQKTGEKFIDIVTSTRGSQLVVMIRNTYEENIRVENDVYYSTKHEGEGIGLFSVHKVVEKYGGLMNVEYDERFFKVNLLLNMDYDRDAD